MRRKTIEIVRACTTSTHVDYVKGGKVCSRTGFETVTDDDEYAIRRWRYEWSDLHGYH